jgi:hypothetical protein
MTRERFARLLRWYPPSWRARYGDELTALLEDTYGSDAVPPRARAGLVRAGLHERLRASGLFGLSGSSRQRVQRGAAVVLAGWCLFVVAGALFGKFTDNWVAGTSGGGRWIASTGYDAVELGGIVGCTLVLCGAAISVPGFVRLVRRGQWAEVRGPVVRAVVAGAGAAVAFAVLVVWAHRLSGHQRNGGSALYGAAFLAVCVVAVVALVLATSAAVAVARRIDLGRDAARAVRWLELTLTGLMSLVLAGTVLWWADLAERAPTVLSGGIGNGLPYASSVVPPTLLVSGLLMVLGLALAMAGSVAMLRSTGTAEMPT